MIGRILLAWGVLARVAKVRIVPGLVGLYLCNLWVLNTIGFALDRLFFPKLGKVRAARPVVIVGNPRTGTTMLQRFLVEQGVGYGLPVWRMVFPSLTVQKLVKPFMPLIEKVDPTRFHRTAAHKTSLTSIEVDDVMLMPRFFDGFFPYGFFLAMDEEDHIARFDPVIRDTTDRDVSLWTRAWARNLVAHDDLDGRAVAKLFSVGPRVPAFQARVPDARILYMVRDPMNTIPSAMNLVTSVLDNMIGWWSLPEDVRERHLTRLYHGLCQLMLRFADDWKHGHIDRDKVLLVHFDRLMSDFDGLMGEILEFVGHEPSPQVQAAIAAKAESQRSYVSKHKYDLAKFGLTEAQVRADLAPFYAAFLPD